MYYILYNFIILFLFIKIIIFSPCHFVHIDCKNFYASYYYILYYFLMIDFLYYLQFIQSFFLKIFPQLLMHVHHLFLNLLWIYLKIYNWYIFRWYYWRHRNLHHISNRICKDTAATGWKSWCWQRVHRNSWLCNQNC